MFFFKNSVAANYEKKFYDFNIENINGEIIDFHDYKKLGVNSALLKHWCNTFGYENVLNRRGTTWRKLDEETKSTINEETAILLMQELPSMIKRPLLDTGKKLVLGFDQSEYESLL